MAKSFITFSMLYNMAHACNIPDSGQWLVWTGQTPKRRVTTTTLSHNTVTTRVTLLATIDSCSHFKSLILYKALQLGNTSPGSASRRPAATRFRNRAVPLCAAAAHWPSIARAADELRTAGGGDQCWRSC